MEHHPTERLSETYPASPPAATPPETEAPAEDRNVSSARAKREGWWAAGLALLYLLFFQVTLRIPFEHIGVIWTTTLLSLLILLLFTVRIARALRSPEALGINLVLAFLFSGPFIFAPVLFARFPGWHGWIHLGPPIVAYFRLIGLVAGLNGLLRIWLAAGLGAWIARLVREMKMLLPIAVALACVDLYVVFGGGPVAVATHGKSHVAQVAMKSLTVSLPTPPQHHAAAPMQLAVGFADFMFIALFFACLARFQIPARRTFFVLYAVLAVYMVLTSYVETLPALVPIAIVMIGMNLRRFRYSRSEVFALLYAGLIVVAVIGGLFFLSRR